MNECVIKCKKSVPVIKWKFISTVTDETANLDKRCSQKYLSTSQLL